MGFLTRNAARSVYLIAGLWSLYMALVPILSGGHSPTLFIVFWIGGALLLMAAIFPRSIDLTIRDSYRVVSPANVFALLGSTVITALLFYQVAVFGALRFGFLRGSASVRLVAYQPNTFDRVSQVLTKPVLIVLVIFSVASLVISALITVRLRSRANNEPTL